MFVPMACCVVEVQYFISNFNDHIAVALVGGGHMQLRGTSFLSHILCKLRQTIKYTQFATCNLNMKHFKGPHTLLFLDMFSL